MIADSVEFDGYAIVPDVLGPARLRSLIAAFEGSAVSSVKRGGTRNLLDLPAARELATSDDLRNLVRPILGDDAFVVRGILFDKTEDANWKVPWHQDVTIAVSNRIEVDGFGPWTTKQGVLHVQPPAYVMQHMLSVRIHLDDCPENNGALRVLPGSHLNGKLGESSIEQVVKEKNAVVCEVKAGGVLLMRPLLLHSSSASDIPRHRRVIHLDFANASLPDGLCWFEQGREFDTASSS
jgi:ectoine hydroxylase-related dioxygenase (phytanoyl-CoA dioxygenase family)